MSRASPRGGFYPNEANGLTGHVSSNHHRQNWDLWRRWRLGSRFSCCSVVVWFLRFERRFGDGAPRGARQRDAAPLRHYWQLNSNQLHGARGAFPMIHREPTSFLERLPNTRNCIIRPFLLRRTQQPRASQQWVGKRQYPSQPAGSTSKQIHTSRGGKKKILKPLLSLFSLNAAQPPSRSFTSVACCPLPVGQGRYNSEFQRRPKCIDASIGLNIDINFDLRWVLNIWVAAVPHAASL